MDNFSSSKHIHLVTDFVQFNSGKSAFSYSMPNVTWAITLHGFIYVYWQLLLQGSISLHSVNVFFCNTGHVNHFLSCELFIYNYSLNNWFIEAFWRVNISKVLCFVHSLFSDTFCMFFILVHICNYNTLVLRLEPGYFVLHLWVILVLNKKKKNTANKCIFHRG